MSMGFAGEDDSTQAVLENMQSRRTHAALLTLTLDQRAVITLKYHKGWRNT